VVVVVVVAVDYADSVVAVVVDVVARLMLLLVMLPLMTILFSLNFDVHQACWALCIRCNNEHYGPITLIRTIAQRILRA
jgi:hypothetical protein